MYVHACKYMHIYICYIRICYMYVRTWVICVHVRAYYVFAFVYVHVCVCRAYLCLYISFQFFDGCQSIPQLFLEFGNIFVGIGEVLSVLVSRVQSIPQLCLDFRNIFLCIGEESFGVGSLTLVCFQ